MLDTVVISGDDGCCRVVLGTLVGVFSVMWSKLLMTSAIKIEFIIINHNRYQNIFTLQDFIKYLIRH